MSISNSTPSTLPAPETRQRTPSTISRTNLILGAVLLIQLALIAYLYWPSDRVALNGEPLLAGVTPDTVTALAITDNNGRRVEFTKEGDTWTLAGTDGYPARADKITETLDKLTKITTDRLVTQTSGSHDRLQVADNNFQRKVEVTTANGLQTLYFGSATGASATHVRAENSDATYLTSDVATWELDTLTTTWIDVAYYQVAKEQIQEVTLENAHGTYTFVRTGDPSENQWTLADATADEPVASANISVLIDRIATLNLQSVLGKSEQPEYGLDAPLATITVTTSETTTGTTASDVKQTTFVVGAKDEESNTYAFKSSDSDYYVRLAAFTGDEFVNKQRSDLMIATTEESDTGTGDASAAPESPSVESAAPITETQTLTDSGEVTDTATSTATLDAGTPVTETIEAEQEPEATPSTGQ